jgi:hypothetical protein
VMAAIRFVWNATRGNRLRPWRSEYLRWRIETYSGMKADEIEPADMARFVWREKWNLLHFLRWTDEIEKQGTGHREEE